MTNALINLSVEKVMLKAQNIPRILDLMPRIPTF